MNIKCDVCGSLNDYEIVYKPKGTKRDVDVAVCNQCGLVFSIVKNIPYSRNPNPSGDADWGNVRFCKSQRFDAVKHLLPVNADTVLDVGSSRGDFTRWMQSKNPAASITALEPDTRVVEQIPGINHIGRRLEDAELPTNYFQFVYCMQTLEHCDSASLMLWQIWDCMHPDGKLFLEVPNIEVIRYPLNVEEFFIDKHNFHFSKPLLLTLLKRLGFRVEWTNNDALNISVMATKTDGKHESFDSQMAQFSKRLIREYLDNITRNRAKLPDVTAKINRILNTDMKVAFWGANTLLDLLVKYGGFDASRVKCLVDTYLSGKLDSVYGVPIQAANVLRKYQPDACIILARHSANEIAEDLRRFWGVRNIIKFSDLLEAA